MERRPRLPVRRKRVGEVEQAVAERLGVLRRDERRGRIVHRRAPPARICSQRVVRLEQPAVEVRAVVRVREQ